MPKTPKKTSQHVLQAPQQLISRVLHVEQFVKRHRKQVIFWGSLVVVGVISIFGYRYYKNLQNEEGQRELFQAVYYFEADSVQRALTGDGVNYGFLELMEKYNGTTVGNLAAFYAGVCHMKLKQYTEAIEKLVSFGSADWLLQARAYALIGDAYVEEAQYEKAIAYYEKATVYKPNKPFTPQYLKKAAVIYEKIGRPEKALDCYARILEEHAGSSLQQEATKQVQRLGAVVASTTP